MVQHSSNANPPTLILTLHSMVRDHGGAQWFAEALGRMWGRLELWYNWFYVTQAGSAPGTYRWVDFASSLIMLPRRQSAHCTMNN